VKTIREYLYPGATTRIIAHTMVWFDGYTHPVQKDRDPGYRSNNAEQVRAQCEQLKACQVDILMYNWYGPNNAFLNESTHNYFNVSPLGHMINIDGGGFHSRDELLSHMRYVRSNFLTHPNYEKWRDKYIVTLFAKSGNDPEWFRALEQENPDCVFAYNSTNWGISQYEWIDPNLEGGVDWFCRTFGDRSDGLFIPAFFPGFNDDNGQGQSVWSPLEPARIWPPGIGANQQTYEACFAAINQQFSTSHQLEYVQAITVNDYEEGSECEEKFFQPADNFQLTENQAWPSWSVRPAENDANHLTLDFNGTTPQINASAAIAINNAVTINSTSDDTLILNSPSGNQLIMYSADQSRTLTIGMANGANPLFSVSTGVITLDAICQARGIQCRPGYNAAPASNSFNINWTGSAQLWIDTTNLGTISTSSDYRLKESVEPLDSGLPLVMKLRPISFRYKDIADSIFRTDGRSRLGFLAHELQELVPGAVNGEKDELTSEGGIQPQTLNLVDVVALLTRAVQELAAKIKPLVID
jgi:Chaperone of endosialidase